MYQVNINGMIPEPDEEILEALKYLVQAAPLRVELKDMLAEPQVFKPPSGETVASLTLIFVCQEIHPLSESRIEKADAQRLKEMLGDSVMKCREDFGTPETLVALLASARVSSR